MWYVDVMGFVIYKKVEAIEWCRGVLNAMRKGEGFLVYVTGCNRLVCPIVVGDVSLFRIDVSV